MYATLNTTEELRAHRGKRVRITFHDGDTHTGVLDGVTSEQIFFAGEGGGVIRTEIRSIQLAPLVCSVCGRETNRLFDNMCADDYRRTAARRPPVREVCDEDECDAPGTLIPGTSLFLCAHHQAQSGRSVRLPSGSAEVRADCALEDVSSSKHVWRQARGARFRCIRCRTAEKWDPALLKELQAGRVEK